MVITSLPSVPAPFCDPSAVRGPVQTVNLQTKTIYSFPVPINSSGIVGTYVWGINSANTLIVGGYIAGTFLRAGGNLAMQGVPIQSFTGSLTGVIAMAANTTAQTVEIQVTGVALTTINWYVVSYPFIK